MSEKYEHRGSCPCGWTGPWRPVDSDAHGDIREHFHAVEHPADFADGDDLMPHERSRNAVERR